MKMRIGFIAVLFFFCTMFVQAQEPGVYLNGKLFYTSGTVTVAADHTQSLTRYKIAWTSDANGVVNSRALRFQGYVRRIAITSSAAVATSPTAAYDIILKDDMDYDILQGAGGNVTASTTTVPMILSTTAYNFFPVVGTCTLNITNAGAFRKGWISVYVDTSL